MNQFLSNEELKKFLPEFIQLYKKRPIKDNKGGMGFNHSFGLYVILKSLGMSIDLFQRGNFPTSFFENRPFI